MTSSVKAATKKPHSDEKDRFPLPNWVGPPLEGSHLDCIKGDKLIQKLFVDELPVYYFGRNVELCEIPVEHASCSRVHAVLLFHKHLKRFALVDLNSSHGTYVSETKIKPLTPVFMDPGTKFYFGASTRRFVIREKIETKTEKADETKNDSTNIPKHILPENEEELDHLTEYNTAQNRRIPLIEQTPEEAKLKKKLRSKLTFAEEEIVINLDDPSQGVFQNLVQTAIIPKKRKLNDTDFDFPSLQSRPKVSLRKLTGDEPEDDMEYSNILGIRMNVAPDVDHMDIYGPKPNEEELHHKKYQKEVWPGRKPAPPIG
jgi:nuclear inhibitor of protein phosphatase 1